MPKPSDDAHDYLPPTVRAQFPTLYSQDGLGDAALVQAKYFTPDSSWTWYATEASAVLPDGTQVPLTDPRAAAAEDVLFFGLVDGMEEELGNWTLAQLTAARGPRPTRLRVERDLYWTPKPLAACRRADRG